MPLNKQCPEGMIRNPATNRCVKIDGKIGKSILKNNPQLSTSKDLPADVLALVADKSSPKTKLAFKATNKQMNKIISEDYGIKNSQFLVACIKELEDQKLKTNWDIKLVDKENNMMRIAIFADTNKRRANIYFGKMKGEKSWDLDNNIIYITEGKKKIIDRIQEELSRNKIKVRVQNILSTLTAVYSNHYGYKCKTLAKWKDYITS